MNDKSDENKGRVREATGTLSDSEKRFEERKADQAVGKFKQTVRKTVACVKDAAEKAFGAARYVATGKSAGVRRANSV